MSRRNEERGRLAALLHHPWTALTTGFGAIASGFGVIDPFALVASLAHIIGATAGTWFPMLGVLRGLGSTVGAIPSSLTTAAFVGGAALYLVYLSRDLLARVKQTLSRKKHD